MAQRSRSTARRAGTPEALILIGSTLFVGVLALSAVFERDIRWLHFFQAMMYVACCTLALRNNRWGYFIGISAAAFWDYGSLFVNNFAMSGAYELRQWIVTGHLRRLDQLVAVPAWIGNLLVIGGCLWAYRTAGSPRRLDALRFVAAFAGTSLFFAGAMALFQPRYLPLFQRSLHPHLPRMGGP